MNKPVCCHVCGKPTTLYGLRAKPMKEDDAYRKRIRDLATRFELEGYATREQDEKTAIACAEIMGIEGETPHMQQLLARHMERLIASQFVGETI